MDSKNNSGAVAFLLAALVVVGLAVLFVAPTAMATTIMPGTGAGTGGIQAGLDHIGGGTKGSGATGVAPGGSCIDSLVNAGVAAYDECVQKLAAQCGPGQTLDMDSVGFDVWEDLSFCTDNHDGTFTGQTTLLCWGKCITEVVEPSRN